jgi:hypothetical protein
MLLGVACVLIFLLGTLSRAKIKKKDCEADLHLGMVCGNTWPFQVLGSAAQEVSRTVLFRPSRLIHPTSKFVQSYE